MISLGLSRQKPKKVRRANFCAAVSQNRRMPRAAPAALSDPCLPCGIDQTFLPPTAENDTTALLSYICAAAMVCHLAVIKSDTRADDAGMCLPATIYTT